MMRNILMGDVTGSRRLTARSLIAKLNPLVDDANRIFRSELLSPLTVTLGDEFQGVVRNFSSTCQIVFWMQDEIRRKDMFSLHFSLVRGEVDTEINSDIAHGMLGDGLTHARELLTRKDRRRPRYQIVAGSARQTSVFNKLFATLAGLEDRWAHKDYEFVQALLDSDNDAEIGDRLGKDRSQIYKRRKTLLTDEYSSVRSAIHELAEMGDDAKWTEI